MSSDDSLTVVFDADAKENLERLAKEAGMTPEQYLGQAINLRAYLVDQIHKGKDVLLRGPRGTLERVEQIV